MTPGSSGAPDPYTPPVAGSGPDLPEPPTRRPDHPADESGGPVGDGSPRASDIGRRGGGRHPEDPEPVPAGKARAVWWLGLIALLTGPLLGGLIPATVAFLLAAQFRQEAGPAQGFLTGAARVRRGERMAWIGVLLAATAVAVAVVAALYQVASTPSGPDFGPEID